MQTLSPTRLHSQYGRVLLVWGVFVAIFGLCALLWPHLTLITLIYLFGVFAIINGVLWLLAAYHERRAALSRMSLYGAALSETYAPGISAPETSTSWWPPLASGVASMIFGFAVIAWPHATALVILYLIAIWAIVHGILQLAAAFNDQTARSPWFHALAGMASIVLGIILFSSSGMIALLSLVWVIGLYALIFGGILIARALRFNSLQGAAPYRTPETLPYGASEGERYRLRDDERYGSTDTERRRASDIDQYRTPDF